jgi:hypothetical protein
MTGQDASVDRLIPDLPHRVNPEIDRGQAHPLQWSDRYGVDLDPRTMRRFPVGKQTIRSTLVVLVPLRFPAGGRHER